ncbi:MAG: hypothetical protein ACI4SQ_01385 [Eubacterium sp.]
MEKKHLYNVLVFLYYYLIAAYVVVYYSCASGGTKKGLVMFAICFVLGVVWISYKWKHKSAKEETQKSEKTCHGIVLAAAMLYTIAMEIIMPENEWYIERNTMVSWALWFGLLLVAFMEKMYTDFYHQKYLLLYANQNASSQMIKRFEYNVKKALWKKLLAFGIFLLLMFAIGVSMQQMPTEVEKVEHKEQQPKGKTKKGKVKQKKTKQLKVQEKKEQNKLKKLLLQFLLRAVTVLLLVIFAISVLLVVYFLLRKLLGIHLPRFEKVQKQVVVVETAGEDVFESLVPKKREQVVWGKDNNSRVRRYFVKTIKKKARGKVPKNLSAREMADEYEIKDSLLVSLYEKARYSEMQCSDEEVTGIMKREPLH